VSKYADHLPLYRQAQIYARLGINLDWSTLADWVGHAAFHLRPPHERLLAKLRQSSKLFADETTMQVLDPGRGRPGSSGLMRPTTGLGAEQIRRGSATSMHPIARLSGRSCI
jgi:hypothetical protein